MDTEITRNETVGELIAQAATIAKSGYAAVREAAIVATEQIIIPMGIESGDLNAVLSQFKKVYADDWGDQTHLISQFNAVATVRFAGEQPISFEVDRTVDGKRQKVEQHTIGTDAASTLSKNDMNAAAKAVREDSATARAPQQKSDAPAQSQVTTVFSIVEVRSQLDGLFKHSKNPVKVLAGLLAEYHCTTSLVEALLALESESKSTVGKATKKKAA